MSPLAHCPQCTVTNLHDLADRGRKARTMILKAGRSISKKLVACNVRRLFVTPTNLFISPMLLAGLPDDLRKNIEDYYDAICERHGHPVSVAVRSSATAEDLPTASFAGQQATFLNVVGAHHCADAVLECLASIFTDR